MTNEPAKMMPEQKLVQHLKSDTLGQIIDEDTLTALAERAIELASDKAMQAMLADDRFKKALDTFLKDNLHKILIESLSRMAYNRASEIAYDSTEEIKKVLREKVPGILGNL